VSWNIPILQEDSGHCQFCQVEIKVNKAKTEPEGVYVFFSVSKQNVGNLSKSSFLLSRPGRVHLGPAAGRRCTRTITLGHFPAVDIRYLLQVGRRTKFLDEQRPGFRPEPDDGRF
jgi:hypothetical protein